MRKPARTRRRRESRRSSMRWVSVRSLLAQRETAQADNEADWSRRSRAGEEIARERAQRARVVDKAEQALDEARSARESVSGRCGLHRRDGGGRVVGRVADLAEEKAKAARIGSRRKSEAVRGRSAVLLPVDARASALPAYIGAGIGRCARSLGRASRTSSSLRARLLMLTELPVRFDEHARLRSAERRRSGRSSKALEQAAPAKAARRAQREDGAARMPPRSRRRRQGRSRSTRRSSMRSSRSVRPSRRAATSLRAAPNEPCAMRCAARRCARLSERQHADTPDDDAAVDQLARSVRADLPCA